MKLKLVSRIVRGKARWCIEQRGGGVRKRTFYKTKALAESALDDFKEQHSVAGSEWAMLPPAERADALVVLHEIREAGKTVREVWSEYKRRTGTTDRITLRDAIAIAKDAQQKRGLSPNTVSQQEYYWGRFARGRESMFADQVTPQTIQDWFNQEKETPMEMQSNLGRLSALFKILWQRGNVSENPCARVPRVKIVHGTPEIFKLALCEKAAKHVCKHQKQFVAWFALGLFAGARPEECDKIKWSDIDLERGRIVIDAAAAKVRDRRIVELLPAAVEWLQFAKKKKAKLGMSKSTRRRWQRELRDALGLDEWPKDVLRHSCASYWLAETQDATQVAHQLGNSVSILMKHYRELVTPEDAKQFWSLRPK